jgi:hypothetical protein
MANKISWGYADPNRWWRPTGINSVFNALGMRHDINN